MAQGKYKKSKLPEGIKAKKSRGQAFTRRANAPIKPKKHKFTEQQKIKQVISRTVNKSVEEEMRSRATEGNLKLSRAQETVAKYHQSANDAKKKVDAGISAVSSSSNAVQ